MITRPSARTTRPKGECEGNTGQDLFPVCTLEYSQQVSLAYLNDKISSIGASELRRSYL